MENVTHGLFGLALAGIALGSPEVATVAQRGAVVATTIVASQLPDADVVYRAFGKWTYLEQHRGWSHSLPATLTGAAVLAGLVSLFFNLSFLFLLFYSVLGVGLHLLSDFTNSFGTQALIPWSRWRIAWDLVPTFDPVMAAILIVGWLAWASRRAEPRAAGLISLLAVAVWVLMRLGLNKWATRLAHDRDRRLMSTIPTIKPWVWRFIASGSEEQVVQGEVNLWRQEAVELGRLKADAEAPLIELLRHNKEGQIFLNHSRHPHVELLQNTAEGSSVLRVTDLAAQKSAAEIEVKGSPK